MSLTLHVDLAQVATALRALLGRLKSLPRPARLDPAALNPHLLRDLGLHERREGW